MTRRKRERMRRQYNQAWRARTLRNHGSADHRRQYQALIYGAHAMRGPRHALAAKRVEMFWRRFGGGSLEMAR